MADLDQGPARAARRAMAVAAASAFAAGALASGTAPALYAAMAVSALLAGPLADRYGRKPVLLAGAAMAAAAPWAVAGAGSLVLAGMASGTLAVAACALAAGFHPEPRRKNAAINLALAPFAAGAALASLVGGPRLAIAVSTLSAAAAAGCAWLQPAAENEPAAHRPARLWSSPLAIALACVAILSAAGEAVLGHFTATFLQTQVGVKPPEVRFLVAEYWGALVAGRLLLVRILRHVRGGAAIRFGALCAVLGIGLLLLVESDITAFLVIALGGLGAAGVFPTTLGMAGSRFPRQTGSLYGFLFAAAAAGSLAFPPLHRMLVPAYGAREAWMLPLLGYVMIIFLQTFIDRALRAPRIAAAVLLLMLAAAGAHAQTYRADYFPMAVWYGGGKARAPMLEPDPHSRKEAWRRDLKQIRALGFNSIRCWIDWASGEPRAGEYRFDTIDVLLALAEEENLRVVIQVYMDAAPDWVGRRFPDSLYESAGGRKMASESSPGFCFDHAGVRKAELDFFTALARRAGKSRAFLGWDLWSEPHVINWATANYLYRPEFCFCPSSVGRFRAWLRKKYGSLDELNRAWYRRFESWDEVRPGRLSTILSYTDYIDWRTFIQEKLGEDLRMRYEAVKRGAPDRIATSHAAIPSLFTSPHAGDGAPDDWIMARQADFYGTSFYPKHSLPVGRDAAWRGALLDFERSSAFGPAGHGGFWVGELQGGFGTVALNVSATVTSDDLRMWSWSALARGAKGINYYAWYPMSTGYESGGYGLIQLDGTLTERSRAAGEIARFVDRNQQSFLRARPPKAQAAIVYNPLSYMVGGRQRAATYAGPQSEVGSIERDSWLGAYRALFPTNAPVDFVHLNEVTAEDLAGYKLVIFPYPLMMPERAAAVLRDYVRAGGTLVSEARLGWNNELGHAAEIIPGLGLHAMTGSRESAVQSVPGLRTELVWTADEIVKPGTRLPGRLYEETLEPVGPDARVAATFANGAPAAVISRYGKGRTLTLGSYLAAAYEQGRDAVLQQFFAALLEWAGVVRPLDANVEVRWLEDGAEKIVFLFNHSANEVDARAKFSFGVSAADLVTGAAVPLPVAKRMSPNEVLTLRVK